MGLSLYPNLTGLWKTKSSNFLAGNVFLRYLIIAFAGVG
tara:strand:- start:825 stop:941 length:117 start_codon:yes stop_codon:yes gene_type:complete